MDLIPIKRYVLIIPYRDRQKHLQLFLSHLEKYHQIMDIYIFEQNNNNYFNRGYLFNAIFEIEKQYDYYIFHDVDLIPDTDIDYCQEYLIPTHLSCYCKQFNYKILDNKSVKDSQMFGGVIAMSRQHLHDISGYNDYYEGWGYEDNDIFRKIQNIIGIYDRKPWTYDSLEHERKHVIHKNLYNNMVTYDLPCKIIKPCKKTIQLISHLKNVYHYHVDVKKMFSVLQCHPTNIVMLINAYNNKQNVIVTTHYVDQAFETFASRLKKSYYFEHNNVTVLMHYDIFYYILNGYRGKTAQIDRKQFYSFNYSTYVFKPIKIISCFPEKQKLETQKLTFNNHFDLIAYYDLNPDIQQSFSLLNPNEIYNHYLTQGINENRRINYINEIITSKTILWRMYTKKQFLNVKLLSRIHFQLSLPKVIHSLNNKTLIVSHPGGGGVEKYLHMLQNHISNYILLIPNSNKMDHVELHIDKNVIYFHEQHALELYNTISMYSIEKIIINHLCIFAEQILQIIHHFMNNNTIVILHDTFLLKRTNMQKLILKHANKIICPSVYLKNCYNKTGIKSILIPHPDMKYPYYVKPSTNVNTVILCIGRIKGMYEIKSFLQNSTLQVIHVGTTNIVHERLFSYGQYDDNELPQIIKNINPTLIWFPSRIPESYCYALSYALMSGYPIVAYKIGSLIERLQNHPYTFLLSVYEKLENKIEFILKTISGVPILVTGENTTEFEYCEKIFD